MRPSYGWKVSWFLSQQRSDKNRGKISFLWDSGDLDLMNISRRFDTRLQWQDRGTDVPLQNLYLSSLPVNIEEEFDFVFCRLFYMDKSNCCAKRKIRPNLRSILPLVLRGSQRLDVPLSLPLSSLSSFLRLSPPSFTKVPVPPNTVNLDDFWYVHLVSRVNRPCVHR